MFKVEFLKYVFDAQHEDPKARFAVLTREEVLPFAPVPGQEIQWPLLRVQKITSSEWSTECQSFRCRVEDEYTVSFLVDNLDFDGYIDDAPERGWKVSGIYPAQGK